MKRFAILAFLIAANAYAQSTRYPATSSGSGSVTSITAGTGLTGGTITTSGTIGLATPVSVANGGTGATSFTQGSVLFMGATDISQDNANFFWDPTNHRLGIGTSAPSVPLQVDGIYTTVATLDAPIMITTTVTAHANNDTPAGLYVDPIFASGGHSGVAPSAAVIRGNSATPLTLITDGDAALEAYNGAAEIMHVTNNGQIAMDGGGAGSASFPDITYVGDAHSGMWITPSLVGFSTASTERMRIVNAGVEIGAGAPQAALDVAGGTIRYGTTYSSGSPPVACSSTVDGLTFLSSTYHLCVCKSATPAYVLVSDGATSCS